MNAVGDDDAGESPTIAGAPPAVLRRPRLDTVTLQVGGGVSDFASAAMNDRTDPGAYWDVRLIYGVRRVLGVEAGYVGAAQPLVGSELDGNASLVRNGVEGSVRLGVPILRGESFVTPFGFGGLGWSRYQMVNVAGSPSGLANADDITTVPVGGGLALGHNGLVFDARFTYRLTFNDDLLVASPARDRELDTWAFGAQLGYEF